MRRVVTLAAVVVVAFASLALPASAQRVDRRQPLPEQDQPAAYTARVSPSQLQRLTQGGFDIPRRVQTGDDEFRVDLILSARDRARAEGLGVRVEENPVPAALARAGEAAAEQGGEVDGPRYARLPPQDGFTVWRSYSGENGFADEMRALTEQNPDITSLEVVGQSLQGQDILAVRLTGPGSAREREERPAVLYNAAQHAREWIAPEVDFRLLIWMLNNYDTDPAIREVIDTTQLWFVPVVNVDGYDYTFVRDAEGELPNRLWRKNLRDNDGDGEITGQDGVDLNRNWPDERWGYDNEGSSPAPTDNTYRGPAPGSEPEVQAMIDLMDRIDFSFQLDYHSFGPLLLFPAGWQQQTFTADDPIFDALTGTDAEPAVPGYDPGVSSELYITNGSVDDYAYYEQDILAWTPELGEGEPGAGFVFPDDEALVQAEFEINIPFALDLAKSADDPANPESHLGNEAEDFRVDSFDVSHGDPQTVQVTAKRDLGPVALRYRINGGRPRIGLTQEYGGGEVYGGDDDVYYHRLRGEVRGVRPGDTVEVWFEAFRRNRGRPEELGNGLGGRRVRSESFVYELVSDTDAPALVVAAEDYTGLLNSPPDAEAPAPAEPVYAEYYTQALADAGYASDVYDVDGNDRRAPHPLGVLSHYEVVIAETGDDFISRSQGQVPGTTAEWAADLETNVRDYLNDGGKFLYAGKYAGFTSAQNVYLWNDPENSGFPGECTQGSDPPCTPLSDDFLQYWLGAYTYNSDAGTNPETGAPFDLEGGETPPFVGALYQFGAGGAGNQDHTASFVPTSDVLDPEEFPQFADSQAILEWVREGGNPYAPLTGEVFVASQSDDESYKRLSRTVGVPAGAESGTALVEFAASLNTEPDWDYVAVEVHPVGSDDWTTLPVTDAATGEVISSQDTGESCPADWGSQIHPFLEHYQTLVPSPVEGEDPTCLPTGTTGEWNAVTGNSGGWQRWQVDLAAYAGQEVEVSIAYVSDFAVQGLGVFIDDATVTVGGEVVAETSFEEDFGGWEVSGPPPGSPANDNDWIRSGPLFDEGAGTLTEDTVYLGFGLEGLATPEQRADLMDRAMQHLLR